MTRRIASLNLLAVALATVASHSSASRFGQAITTPVDRPARRRIAVRSRSHLPHQNLRECARRVGGDVWQEYKNARRVWRGLEPR